MTNPGQVHTLQAPAREAAKRSTRVDARLLVIDDEWATRGILDSVFTAEGFQVDLAEDGAKGLQMLAQRPYDLAIVDLNMPGIGGLEVLRFIEEQGFGVVTIVTTGYGPDLTTLEALNAGAFGCIPKPFRLEEAKHLARKALEFQRLRAENREMRHRLHASEPMPAEEFPDRGVDLNALVDAYESALIEGAMKAAGGVKSRAAELLGIKRTTLAEKIRKRAGVEAEDAQVSQDRAEVRHS